MSLPIGTVDRYEVQVTPSVGGELPLSFDQRRHVELGRRPGSWMALAFRLPFPASQDQVAAAWLSVVQQHGTLRTVVTERSGAVADPQDRYFLQQVDISPGHWSRAECAPGEDPRSVLRRLFDTACQPFARPSHQLCLVTPADPAERASVVIGLDHSHVDAWSLLVLLRDFLAAVSVFPSPVAEKRSRAFAEHTLELEASPPAPVWVRARWASIMSAGGGDMPTFPGDLGDVSEPRPEVVEVHDVFDREELATFEQHCRDTGARMISLAVSHMTRATLARTGQPLRAVFPVHSRYDERWHDSVGWFITNSVLESSDPDPAACAREIRSALALGSHPLAPILAPWGGMPHSRRMFAISWLDNRRLPVDVDLTLEPQHVSAEIRTTGVMVWFVVNASGMHLRCRYPDTAQARASVASWLADVRQGLRAELRESVPPLRI